DEVGGPDSPWRGAPSSIGALPARPRLAQEDGPAGAVADHRQVGARVEHGDHSLRDGAPHGWRSIALTRVGPQPANDDWLFTSAPATHGPCMVSATAGGTGAPLAPPEQPFWRGGGLVNAPGRRVVRAKRENPHCRPYLQPVAHYRLPRGPRGDCTRFCFEVEDRCGIVSRGGIEPPTRGPSVVISSSRTVAS